MVTGGDPAREYVDCPIGDAGGVPGVDAAEPCDLSANQIALVTHGATPFLHPGGDLGELVDPNRYRRRRYVHKPIFHIEDIVRSRKI